ncbi:MFS transporter, partial [Arsukibacterium sp.]|uniref:MFS transporter n=1 Tax=Arsukibacterium sp. TaxID=1977258 RepID=UPI00299F388F
AGFYQSCFALCLAAIVVFANLHLLQPLLPQLSRDFQISPLQANLSYIITTLGLGISLLVYASLSDAWGRKSLLLITLSGMTISTLALTQVDSFNGLVFWRAVQGLCLGGLPAIAIAWMGEEYTTPALVSAVGYYISASSLGGIGGRLLAGGLADWGHWQWVFWPMALLSAVSCYGIWRFLPQSSGFTRQPFRLLQALKNHGFHLRQPLLLLTYLIGGLNFLVFLNQYTFVSFMLAAPPYLLSSSMLGLLFITYFSGTVGSAFSARIAKRISAPLAMALGTVLLMLGTLVTLHSAVWLIVGGFFISAFGFFLCHSLASSWVNQHARRAKASASALYLVFYYVGASIGGFYLQPFWQWLGWSGVVLASWLMYGITLLLTVLLWLRSR